MKNVLSFKLSEDSSQLMWSADNLPVKTAINADFWRIIADDSYYMEIPIRSSAQSGSYIKKGNETIITYNKLLTETGRVFNVDLILTIKELDDRLEFSSIIKNNTDGLRIDELQFPYLEFNKLCGEREDDILYRPRGLGERIKNPWKSIEKEHTEYMSADYDGIKSNLAYPRFATMTWMGIQSGNYFLYIAKHDERTRICALLNCIQPRESKEKKLALSICQYPFVRTGEYIEVSKTVVFLAEGDWKTGSDIYGSFARNTFYHPVKPKKWVYNITGWQRIILRHQFGEINWRYEDLPKLYLEGKKYGLNTLLIFGWWRGRFDNGYPLYEVDEELGGAQKLKEAIAEIRQQGGYVILYNNGILIDKVSDFYKEHHNEAAKIDIDGNEYEDHYKFDALGTVLNNYGYKSFVDACQATDIWLDKLKENCRIKLEFNPDSVFFDQVGGRCYLCFNPKHKHGYRPDDEMVYRRENIRQLREMCQGEIAIGTEYINDAMIGEFDYIHGRNYASFYKDNLYASTENLYPQLFLRTFPEPIITNRLIHDCREGFRNDLNYAFLNGFRFDVAIYRGRKTTIAGLPEYAEHIKKIMDKKEQYKEFFYGGGKFVCETELSLPPGVEYREFALGSRRMFTLWNSSNEKKIFEILGKKITLDAFDIDCITNY